MVGAFLATFEELDRALVLLRSGARRERAQIATSSRPRIDFPRVEAVFARFQPPNHSSLLRFHLIMILKCSRSANSSCALELMLHRLDQCARDGVL